MNTAILVAATFAACAVEMVEALTIVLAVGITHGWHAVRLAVAAALAALAVIVAALGPTLTLIPLGTFWGGESAGVDWPGGDLAILGLLTFYGLVSWALVVLVRRRQTTPSVAKAGAA